MLPRNQSSAASTSPGYGRRTENVTYQTSRTVRQTHIAAGAVKRLSISILADHTLRYDQGKPVVEPPTPEKLQVIKDLVTAAAGLDTARGDVLVVEAFPFESTLSAQPLDLDPKLEPAPSGPRLPEWLRQGKTLVIAGAAGGGLLLLLAVVFFLWRRRRKKKVQLARELTAGARHAGTAGLDGQKEIEARMAGQAAEQQRIEAEALLALKLPAPSTKKTDVLTKHIATEVKKDPAGTAQVVRSWLHGDYQR